MEETNITTSFIRETGYTTWMDFYLNKDSYSESNGVYTFGYINTNNEKSKIILPFNCIFLRKMVLEEIKLMVRQIDIISFSELLEKKENFPTNSFDFEIVIIEEDEPVSYKKITFSLADVELLSEIEKKNYSYLSYKIKPGNKK
jgi:hypothetical protein